MYEDDRNRRMQRVNAFKGTYFEFVKKKTWSDESSLKLRGIMNRHKWVYWYTQIPQVYEENALPSNFNGLAWNIIQWCHWIFPF